MEGRPESEPRGQHAASAPAAHPVWEPRDDGRVDDTRAALPVAEVSPVSPAAMAADEDHRSACLDEAEEDRRDEDLTDASMLLVPTVAAPPADSSCRWAPARPVKAPVLAVSPGSADAAEPAVPARFADLQREAESSAAQRDPSVQGPQVAAAEAQDSTQRRRELPGVPVPQQAAAVAVGPRSLAPVRPVEQRVAEAAQEQLRRPAVVPRLVPAPAQRLQVAVPEAAPRSLPVLLVVPAAERAPVLPAEQRVWPT